MFPNGVSYYLETELLDYALTLGMNPDQYWYDDPRLLDNYEQSFMKKSKKDLEQIWLQGLYFKMALSSTVVPSVMANRKIINSMPHYPSLNDLYNESNEMTEEEISQARKKVYEFWGRRGKLKEEEKG